MAVLKGKEFNCVYQRRSEKGFRNFDLTDIQSAQNRVESEANLLLPKSFSSPFLMDVPSSSSSMGRGKIHNQKNLYSLLPSETDCEINFVSIEGFLQDNNNIYKLETEGCKAFFNASDSSCSESEKFEDDCSSICSDENWRHRDLDCLFVEEIEDAGSRNEHRQEDNRDVASRHYLEDCLGQGDLSKLNPKILDQFPKKKEVISQSINAQVLKDFCKTTTGNWRMQSFFSIHLIVLVQKVKMLRMIARRYVLMNWRHHDLDCLFVEEMEDAGSCNEHPQEDNRDFASRHYLEDCLGQGSNLPKHKCPDVDLVVHAAGPFQ